MLSTHIIDQIDELLPQTQCTRCGYPSCRDYAAAIANDEAKINQCPPGGNVGIKKLAQLLNKPVIELNPENGFIKPKTLVIIDEDACIGCTLCIKACPVDAILGSNKMTHTILPFECTGCDLCIPACPVDCMHIIDDPDDNWSHNRINLAKMRYDTHNLRIKQDRLDKEARLKNLTIL
ncbi:MAG: RnfABCDGE type electron transport complex subunit B [Proteobacteria bacterium]|jgi:electron transport complex protein RnfB|nr:RnfABCDGE type electron transport complex subunit B [Pseudomonadota bacterium]